MATFQSLIVKIIGALNDALWKMVISFVEGNYQLVQDILRGSTPSFFILCIELWLLLVIYRTLYMVWRLSYEFTSYRSGRFSATPPNSARRILIVGDSTAYGTGAAQPRDSIAGRLANDFPTATIINNAVNGSLTVETLKQLTLGEKDAWDMIIICTGGNDIWHFTNLKRLESNLSQVLQTAIAMSNHRVIVLFYANMGSAPVFPKMIRNILSRRSEQVRKIFFTVCNNFKVPCIDLYTHQEDSLSRSNPFLANPKKYYAKDFMHPSSEGYRLWYNHMWKEMVAQRFFLGNPEPPITYKH